MRILPFAHSSPFNSSLAAIMNTPNYIVFEFYRYLKWTIRVNLLLFSCKTKQIFLPFSSWNSVHCMHFEIIFFLSIINVKSLTTALLSSVPGKLTHLIWLQPWHTIKNSMQQPCQTSYPPPQKGWPTLDPGQTLHKTSGLLCSRGSTFCMFLLYLNKTQTATLNPCTQS